MSSLTMLSILILAVAFVAVAEGVTCPNAPSFKNPVYEKVKGQWFVQLTSVFGLIKPNAKCMMRTLTPKGNNTLDLHIDYLDIDTGAGEEISLVLVAKDANDLARLTVQNVYITDVHVGVDSDYTGYLVFYACMSINDSCQGYYVVGMTRERKMSPKTEADLRASLTKYNLAERLEIVDQENCK